jgi:cytochrome c peroxidase
VHKAPTKSIERKTRRATRRRSWRSVAIGAAVATCALAAASALTGIGWAGGAGDRSLAPLDSVQVPEPPDLANYVVDRQAAIALGKAFFWEQQAGSDGVTACATCHFNAGADSRSKNQLNPDTLPADSTKTFDMGGPNFQLTASSFPFHKLADPNNAAGAVLSDSKMVAGSQSIINTKFVRIVPGGAVEIGTPNKDGVFNVGGVNVRQVTPRNAPTVINSVFNSREQWDMKAQSEFDGVDPFGPARSKHASVFQAAGPDQIVPVQVDIQNAALASQAVGPMTNGGLMSFAGRTFPDIGKKLTSLRPLGEQSVSSSDSVLAAYANPGGKGLSVTYAQLIQRAFAPQWWSSNSILRLTKDVDGNPAIDAVLPSHTPLAANEYTLMQANFSLFWGLAVQLYESTLVSDQTPVDRYLAGDNQALTKDEQEGLSIFGGKGHCSTCHGGAELTNASVDAVAASPVSSFSLGGGKDVVHDTGAENIGVRPLANDPGQSGLDKFKNSLSNLRFSGQGDANSSDGMLKIPSLRNVALTAPYFHNGGQLTLRQVVDFYNRGGDFDAPNKNPEIRPLGLTEAEKNSLVAFLQALTDPRVPGQQAPFDHPELLIPNGHPGDNTSVQTVAAGVAAQDFLELPAVGAGGASAEQAFPNFPFLAGLLQPLPGSAFQPTVPPAAPAPAPAAPAPAAPAPAAKPKPAAPVTPVIVPVVTPAAPATRTVVTVSLRLKVSRGTTLVVRAVDPKSALRLSFLSGSSVGKTVAAGTTKELRTKIARAGVVQLKLRMLRSELASGQRYRVVVRTLGPGRASKTVKIGVTAP